MLLLYLHGCLVGIEQYSEPNGYIGEAQCKYFYFYIFLSVFSLIFILPIFENLVCPFQKTSFPSFFTIHCIF